MFGVVACVLAVVCKAVQIFATIQEDAEQWRIQGSVRGARLSPLFLDQTEARRTKKTFLMTGPSHHPPPPAPLPLILRSGSGTAEDCYSVILLYSTYFHYLSFHVWLYSHVFNFFSVIHQDPR